jgi:hypothetical protein
MHFCKIDAVVLAILFVINFLFPYISGWLCDIDTAFSMEIAVSIQGVEVVLCVTPRIHIHYLEYTYCNPMQDFQHCYIQVA